MPPLPMSSAGGVAVRAYDGRTLYGTTGGGGFIYCVAGVAWEVFSHSMSVIVVETCKGLGWGRSDR